MAIITKDALVESYRNKYKGQFKALESSPLAEHRGITERDIIALGKQLDQASMWESFLNENAGGYASDLGQLPKKALSIITAAYGTSVIPELCSVQPIEEEQGIVWYKDVVAKTDRGNMKVDDELFNSLEMPAKYPNGYANAMVRPDMKAIYTTASQTSTAGEVPAAYASAPMTGTFDSAPIRPHSLSVMIQHGKVDSTNFVVEFTEPNVGVDDGKGYIMGRELSGTINYETGAFELRFFGELATAIGQNKIALIVNFEQNFEQAGNNQIGKIQYELKSKNIRAQVFALTEQLGLLKSYSMQKRFQMSAEDEMVNDLINSLTLDVGGAVLTSLIDGARAYRPKGATDSYKNSIVYNMKSYQAPILSVQTLNIKVNEAAQKIYTQSGRGEGNIICASPKACVQFASLPDFKPSGISIQGPHVFGTLNGVTIIRVPQRVLGFENENTCLVVYKGTGEFDAPAIWAPFMPLYVSGSIPMLNNPLMKQGVVCTWAGLSTTCPQFLTEIEFSNSYNPDEQFPTWQRA